MFRITITICALKYFRFCFTEYCRPENYISLEDYYLPSVSTIEDAVTSSSGGPGNGSRTLPVPRGLDGQIGAGGVGGGNEVNEALSMSGTVV